MFILAANGGSVLTQLNESPHALTLNGINVVSAIDPLVWLSPDVNEASVGIDFNIVRSVAPTLVEIDNRSGTNVTLIGGSGGNDSLLAGTGATNVSLIGGSGGHEESCGADGDRGKALGPAAEGWGHTPALRNVARPAAPTSPTWRSTHRTR